MSGEQTSMTVDEALSLALRHHQSGDLDTAETIYRAILGAAPRHADALNLLGAALQQRGRAAEAVESFGRALDARPDFPEAHNNLGNALRDLGQREAAAAHYRAALDQRPGYGRAHRNLADALHDLGRPGEAAAHYRAALAAEPMAADTRNNLGNALRALGDRAAPAAFRAALALRPDFAEALGNLGTILLDDESPAEALAALTRAARLKRDLPPARLARAEALRALGRPAAAEEAGVALALAPDEPRALAARLRAAFDAGEKAGEDAATGGAAPWQARADRLAGRAPEPARTLRLATVAEHCRAHGLPYRTVRPARRRLVATGSAAWGTVEDTLPEIFLARVDGATIIPANHALATPDGALLLDGLHAYSRRSLTPTATFLHEAPDGRVLARVAAPSRRIDDEAVLLGGDGNFAHGVLDWLSRAYTLAHAPELAGLPVLVSAALRPAVAELLEPLGIAADRLVRLPAGETVECRRLWVPSLTHRFQYMAPEYLEFLRTRAAAAFGAPAGVGARRRLYLARRATGHRALLNEAEVLAALAPLGIEPLYAEDLTLAEQVRAFGAAELIVMPIGGGSAGIAFAPRGAGVVELTHARCVLPQYGILAGLLEQRYRQIVGAPEVNRGALAFDWDFTVPPDAAAAAARWVLEPAPGAGGRT